MAARVTRAQRAAWPAAALAASLALAGCFAPAPANQPPENGTPLPTPVASLTTQLDGTVALVREALARANLQANPSPAPYRPSEPQSLVQVPRTVVQEQSFSNPNVGVAVIYDLASADAAAAAGQDFANYLQGGFGQTNYPLDAQFALSQVGGTLIFTWWSASRAPDDTIAEAGFNAVAGVGTPIPILK